MAHDSCPDIFGMCETSLTDSISDDQIAIDGYDILRKDESDTQKKSRRRCSTIFSQIYKL